MNFSRTVRRLYPRVRIVNLMEFEQETTVQDMPAATPAGPLKLAPQRNPVELTKREEEILQLIAEEYTSQEIAGRLFISMRTVEVHRLNLTQKLSVRNVAGLVKEAVRRGLVK
ncbi:LuxR C-terminal-related transcriptional regulator [Chitinophaga sp. Cy-1792]|uniref:helix-turn-helix domain-containing protein n=1 Tax=Chitinophaga sp. Cy-1792 TaxID=2608339 RepID=UPI001F03E599|nr:LuxR C-terminal-related transcriptional regulator [Chitinophaga sp. Cy-1792]